MEDEVKLLKERMLIEFRKQDRSGVYGFTQREMAYNSNRIEGSTLSKDQTASLFYTRTVESDDDSIIIRSKDIEEMTGKLIKSYHYRLKKLVFEDMANGYPVGEYKNRANIVSGIKTCPPEEVEEKINELFDWYEAHEKNLGTLAKLHIEYEKIHPFQDGNGRTGRIILYKECLRNGIYPFVIEDSRKVEYYHALRDEGQLEKLFASEQSIYRENTVAMVVPVSRKNGMRM